MASRDEQETTITSGRNEKWVYIWTNDTTVAAKLEKNTRVQRISEDSEGIGGEYRVLKSDFNVIGGFKRRVNMTDEQKKAAAERLRKGREQR